MKKCETRKKNAKQNKRIKKIETKKRESKKNPKQKKRTKKSETKKKRIEELKKGRTIAVSLTNNKHYCKIAPPAHIGFGY